MHIQVNPISFSGWEPSQVLKDSGKINNADVLEALANVSNVDCIRTNMVDSQCLPFDNLYTNIVSKKVGDRFVYGVDCVILPKNASSENVSENIFMSVQRAVGDFYAKMANINLSQQVSSVQILDEVNKPELLNVSKKSNIFKKFLQFLSKI